MNDINNMKLVPKVLEIDANDGPVKAKLEELARMGIEDKHFDVVAELDTSSVDGYRPPNKYGTVTYLPSRGMNQAVGGPVTAGQQYNWQEYGYRGEVCQAPMGLC